jgi:hypothetical protein
MGVVSVLAAITDEYSCTPTVVLMRDNVPLWSGTTRIQGLALDPWSHGLEIDFSFAPSLQPPELARLGVA